MKKLSSFTFCLLLLLFGQIIWANSQNTWIRVNQAGYLPNDIKVAVLISLNDQLETEFEIFDALSDKLIFKSKADTNFNAKEWGMSRAMRLNFSEIKTPGGYYIKSNGVKSIYFKIDADSYNGASDFLLNYMRQQRCGDNPYTGELCHLDDGYIVDHPTRSGEKIDVTGGWHDATDYLQYLTTSATSLYHMMFAWEHYKDKGIFKDEFDHRGRKGANGVPDIIDEIKWGLDWLVKMNPEDGIMFNQIADDRDHSGFRLPHKDQVDYGWGPGKGRPVYFVTGQSQGLGKHKNRTTGVSSTAGKFSSSFALGSYIFKDIDTVFANKIYNKALAAYEFGLSDLGTTQTACLKSKYFYEEDTYVDDLELAAATFYRYENDGKWREKADYWGELEPITPWMELGRGRHYQYYPFINLGHYYLAQSSEGSVREKYLGYMRDALEHLRKRGERDPFLYGIPSLWCSNNLVSAAVTYCHLYREASGDNSYLEMEMALRDWLFGCNPWGKSMVVGLPASGNYPRYPHSSYTVINGDLTYGGLIDGPIDRELFLTRAGNSLTKPDAYAVFNNGKAVYHDDIGDYSSNEPTMDGSAGLTYYFAAMEAEGRRQKESIKSSSLVYDNWGAVIRKNSDSKDIYLIFSADSMFQGGRHVLDVLKKAGIKGSFFVTGNFLRLPEHSKITERIIKEGHYIGAHSDKHLLYAPWDNRDSSLIGVDSLIMDIKLNYKELNNKGVNIESAIWYLPPYEWYNRESVEAASLLGLKTINYTPGTATPADYTTPDMKNYRSSDELIERLYKFEKKEGLHGAIILIHPGVHPSREDRLYNRLAEIIDYLKSKGYSFERF
mgnify:CR=1 FL=1